MDNSSSGDQHSGDEASIFQDELEVLSPEHPLMNKFQNALKSHLQKLQEKLREEQTSRNQHLREKLEEREKLGVKIYKLQEVLVQRQDRLKQYQKNVETAKVEADEGQERLAQLKLKYEELLAEHNTVKQEEQSARNELNKVTIQKLGMKLKQQEMDAEAQIAQRALSKTEKQIQDNEEQKQKQDLYIEQLSRDIADLTEQLNRCVKQWETQKAQAELLQSATREARAELEALRVEKRQLIGGWQASLRGLQARDATRSSMLDMLRQEKDHVAALILEINGLKASQLTAMEDGEKLTIQLHRHQGQEEQLKEQLKEITQENHRYQLEYADFGKLLKETEQQLKRTNVEFLDTDRDCRLSRDEIQKLDEKRISVEDDIMEYVNNNLLVDNTAGQVAYRAKEMRQKNKQMEYDIAEEEQELGKENVEINRLAEEVSAAKDALTVLENKMMKEQEALTESERIVQLNNRNIDKNELNMHKLEEQYQKLVVKAGGTELSPLEREIASLKKELDCGSGELEKLRNHWMRHQHHLVKLTSKQEKLDTALDFLRQKMLVLEQRKLRRETEISSKKKGVVELEKTIRELQQTLEKGHTQLVAEKGRGEDMQHRHYLAEQELNKELKDLELKSLEIKKETESVIGECNQIQGELLSIEEEGLMWERKLLMAQEAKELMNQEKGENGEITNLKANIHKLEVSLGHLDREEQELSKLLEDCVFERERCIDKADCKLKLATTHKVRVTTERSVANLQSELNRLRKECAIGNKDLTILKEHEEQLKKGLKREQETILANQKERDEVRTELHKLQVVKRKKLEDLVLRQEMNRHLESAAVRRYTELTREHSGLDAQVAKHKEYSDTLLDITRKLAQDFPKLKEDMGVVEFILTGDDSPVSR